LDIGPREVAAAAPLGLLIVVLGVAPAVAISLLSATVSRMATLFHG
jgi:NADH:ubiquinone oxidoreductase subunit 4 (subunit M)